MTIFGWSADRRFRIWVIAAAVALVIYFLFFSPKDEKNLPGSVKVDPGWLTERETTPAPRATIVMLLKNADANAYYAIESMDKNFNQKHGYPLTIFHEDLPAEAQQVLQTKSTGKITFAQIKFELPEWVNASEVPAKIGFWKESMGYRHMCRFYSGMIFRHPALKQYDYMWRLDDDAEILCPVFRYMREYRVKYGWAQWFYEHPTHAANTLWDATKEFVEQAQLSHTRLNQIATFLGNYDRCHYWNNFEVVDLNWVRGPQYTQYFDFLDHKAGWFFYRWGDALVRTLAIHMFLEPEEVERLSWISYRHGDQCVNRACSSNWHCSECPEGLCKACQTWLERKTRGIELEHVIVGVAAIALGIACGYYAATRHWGKRKPYVLFRL